MAAYRFYFLDDLDHIVDTQCHELPGDGDASEKARILARESGIEVWKEKTLVIRLKKIGDPIRVTRP